MATARPSVVILIFRLLLLELIFVLFYSLIKVPQIVFSMELGVLLTTANLIAWLVIIVLSLTQMVAVTVAVLMWANEYYLIREGSVVHHFGVFRAVEEEYSLRNIEALTLEQNIIQKLFGYGTIRFFSPVLKQDYYLTNIGQPKMIRDLIDEVVNNVKTNRGEKIIFRR